jgi:DNA-binding SARP family transcriptional activator
MEACAARGDVAEALRAYDTLRTLLREELGVLPSQGLVKLNDRLLGTEAGLPGAEVLPSMSGS